MINGNIQKISHHFLAVVKINYPFLRRDIIIIPFNTSTICQNLMHIYDCRVETKIRDILMTSCDQLW